MGSNDVPTLSGAFAPIASEQVITDGLEIEGDVPADLNGLYVRNGPNRRFEAPGRYHWFDGDGMLHAVRFKRGRVEYRNRWVMTDGLQEEVAAGRALWQGIKDPPQRSRPGAPVTAPMKNTSNTDVKYFGGSLISMWYLGGDVYRCDPHDLRTLGKLGTDLPARFGVVPRHGSTEQIRWFEADPTYLYHVSNAWEEDDGRGGTEIVMTGTPFRIPRDAQGRLDADAVPRLTANLVHDFTFHEWRFNLRTGQTRERVLDDIVNSEFPVINSWLQGHKTRYSWHTLMGPAQRPEEPRFCGIVRHDLLRGNCTSYHEGPNRWWSEAPFARHDGSQAEDDGYLVGFVWDGDAQRSKVVVLDAADIAAGPLGRITLPSLRREPEAHSVLTRRSDRRIAPALHGTQHASVQSRIAARHHRELADLAVRVHGERDHHFGSAALAVEQVGRKDRVAAVQQLQRRRLLQHCQDGRADGLG